jgi:hypothetical protein
MNPSLKNTFRRLRIKKRYVGLCLVLLVYVAWRLALIGMVNFEVTKLRSRGLPASHAELNTYFMTPSSDQNSAALYEKAARLVVDDPFFQNDQRERDLNLQDRYFYHSGSWTPWSVKWIDDARVYFVKNQDAFDLIDQAAELPDPRFSMKFRDYDRLVLPMIHRVQYEAETGNSETATRLICQSWGLENSMTVTPGWIDDFHTIIDAQSYAFNIGEATEQVMNRVRLSESQLARISARLEKVNFDDYPGLDAADRVYVIEGDYERENRKSLAPWQRLVYDCTGMSSLDTLNALSLIRERESIPKRASYIARLDVLGDIEERMDSYRWFISSKRLSRRIIGFGAAREATAQILCLRAAVAVERYRRAHEERVPMKLEDLVPQFLPGTLINPFSGEPVVITQTADAYTVKSVSDASDHRHDWELTVCKGNLRSPASSFPLTADKAVELQVAGAKSEGVEVVTTNHLGMKFVLTDPQAIPTPPHASCEAVRMMMFHLHAIPLPAVIASQIPGMQYWLSGFDGF